MSGKKSKNKGARAEREVCELLHNWWTQDFHPSDDEVKFTRSPLSGGWGGKREFGTAGDIICSDETFPFCIEVKHRESFSEDRLFAGKVSPAWKWISQCEQEAKLVGKIPLLFFRKNHMEWNVAIPEAYVRLEVSLIFPDFKITLPEDKFVHDVWFIMRAENFFEVSPEEWIDD